MRGMAAIISVLVIGAVLAVWGVMMTLTAINSGQNSLSSGKKLNSRAVVESCVEEALMKINTDNSLPSTISTPMGNCELVVNSQIGSSWQVTVSQTVENYLETIKFVAVREGTVKVVSWQEE